MSLAGSLELQLYADVARIRDDMRKVEGIVSGSMQKVAQSAAFAMRALGALGVGVSAGALVAFVKNVNNAVDALNDLKDATGASIENISALEDIARRNGASLETVGTALVKFNQALGGTVKPGTDAEKVLEGIGLNAKELRELDPAVAMMKTAQALAQFADDGGKARAVQELFGKSLREVAPLLKDMAERGEMVAKVTTQQAEEAEKFNKQLFALQKNSLDASRAMVANLVPALNQVFEAFNKGGFKAALDQLGNQLFDWEGNALRKGLDRLKKDVEDAQKRVNFNTMAPQSIKDGLVTDLQNATAAYEAARKAYFKLTDVQGGRGNVNPALADMRASLEGIIKDAPKAAKAIRELTEEEKDRNYHREFNRKRQVDEVLAARREAEELLKLQRELRREEDEANRSAFGSLAKRVADLREEAATYGLLESQIASITLARLEDMRVAAAAGADNVEWIDELIAKQRELIALLGTKEVRDANAKAAKEAADAWERTNEQIADSFVDNLMRGGKSVAQYLKDLFRTLVLRPLLQPIGNIASSLVSGGLSMAGNALGLGNLLGATGVGMGTQAALGFANVTGAGLDGFLAASGGFGTMGAGESLMGMMGAIPGWGWAAMAAAAVAGLLANGGETRVGGQYQGSNFVGGPDGGQISGAQSLLQPTIATINATLAALGATQTLSNFVSGLEQSQNGKGFAYAGGSLSNGTVFGQGVDGQGFMNRRGSMTDQQALAAFTEELAQTRLEAIQASDAVGPLAEWVRSLGDVSLLTGESLMSTVARLDKAIAEKATLEERLYAATATEAEMLARARERERATIDPLNLALYDQVIAAEDLKTATEALAAAQEQAAQVAQQAADDLLSKLKAVRPFFMTDAEYKQMTATEIAGTFNAKTGANITPEFVLGLTAQDYRDYFEQFVAAGNQEAIAAMIDLAPAFQTLVQSVSDAIAAEEARLKAIADERYGLETRLLTLQGDTAALRARELALLDPSNRALQEQIWALEDAKAAEDARTAALQRQRAEAQRLREEWSRLTGSMMDEVMRLRTAINSGTPQQSLAYLQSQFAIANAAARAGDMTAAGQLPGLSQAVEQAAMRSAGSLAELNTIRAQLATSLESTASIDPQQAIANELREMRRENRELSSRVEGRLAALEKVGKQSEQHQKTVADVFDDIYDKSNGSINVTTV